MMNNYVRGKLDEAKEQGGLLEQPLPGDREEMAKFFDRAALMEDQYKDKIGPNFKPFCEDVARLLRHTQQPIVILCE